MIDRDLVELLGALAVIVACAVAAIASASPASRDQPAARRGRRGRRAARRAAGPEPSLPAPVAAPAATGVHPALRARPRILTGEPAAPEPRRPAARRAIKLVGGVTALAAAGAVGLLVLVRALVAMFNG